jgi:CDP-diacylglycerol--glycerol-3-phosphate 3-phosphatidyltransferase
MQPLAPTLGEQVASVTLFALIILTAVLSMRAWRRHAREVNTLRGSIVLSADLRAWYMSHLAPFEDFCVNWGIRPAALSFLQLGGSLLVAWAYACGLLFTGGWLLLGIGTLDIIDGRVARRTNSSSARGAFLDSVVDRYADALALTGLAIFFRTSWVLWAVLLALLGSVMVSYTRARGEALGVTAHVGLLQRPERYVILGFGTIFGALWDRVAAPLLGWPHSLTIATIVAVAVLVNFSALQRATHIWQALDHHAEA